MTFLRSPLGIANRAKFSGAQLLVYIEEAPNARPTGNVDRVLWRRFFETFYPTTSVIFGPLGGKAHVLTAAAKLISGNIRNAVCALDRDYMDAFGGEIVDPHVLYTFGYGAESDLYSRRSLAVAFEALMPGIADLERHRNRIWNHVKRTHTSMRPFLISDQDAFSRSTNSVIDRDHPRTDFVHDAALPVNLDIARLNGRVAAIANLQVLTPATAVLDNWYNLPSHSHQAICYLTIARYVRAQGGPGVNEPNLLAVLFAASAGNFIGCLPREAIPHYRRMGARPLP